MQKVNIRVEFNKTFNKENIISQQIHILGVEPFIQKTYNLKNFNEIIVELNSGLYCINPNNFKNNQFISVIISLNDKSIEDFLTSNKCIYFEITNNNTINYGNKMLFNKKYTEYSNNLSKFKTIFWNIYWKILHTISFEYPINPDDNNKSDISKLIYNMNNGGISCHDCALHFKTYSDKNKIELCYNNKEQLFKYFVDLHNDVNIKTNKQLISIENAKELYKNSNNELINEYNIDVKNYVLNYKLSTLPNIINTKIKNDIMKKYNIV